MARELVGQRVRDRLRATNDPVDGRVQRPEASMPVATVLKDWAADPLTATGDDPVSTGHPPPVSTWVHGPWASRLLLASSATSPTEAGYLSGAVEASTLAAEIVGMSHQRQARA